MFVQRTILCLVLSFYLFVIPKVSSQSICTSKEIFDNNVGKCLCRAFTTPISATSCNNKCTVSGSCGSEPADFSLANCNGDCTYSSNSDCDACGIWLHSLCECLQGLGHCTESTPGGWWRLGQSLATPNQPIRNILDLQMNPNLAPLTWNFGQTVADLSTTGLAINPARTVTQDQVHMHICPVNSNMQGALAKLTYQSYSSLNAVQLNGAFSMFANGKPNQMWCQVAPSKTSNIAGSDVDKAIRSVLAMPGICDYQVAAAMIKDTNGYTWACVTADRSDAEHRFLQNCP